MVIIEENDPEIITKQVKSYHMRLYGYTYIWYSYYVSMYSYYYDRR